MRALFRLVWEKGLTPIPTKEKKPLIAWGDFVYRKMTAEEFEDALFLVKEEFAIITGQQIGNKFLVVVDVDDPSKISIAIPSYATKTRRGYHIPYYSKYPLPTQKIDGMEIHGSASLIMFPGSIVGDVLYDGNPSYYFDPPHIIPQEILSLFRHNKKKRAKENKNFEQLQVTTSIDEIKELANIIRPLYQVGRRHNIALGISALLKRKRVPIEQALALFKLLPDDEDRTPQIISTYEKDHDEIASYFWCPEVIEVIWQTDIIERLVRRFAESS